MALLQNLLDKGPMSIYVLLCLKFHTLCIQFAEESCRYDMTNELLLCYLEYLPKAVCYRCGPLSGAVGRCWNL